MPCRFSQASGVSQGGMALRWHKIGKLKAGEEMVERGSTLHFVKDWAVKMSINGFGALSTAVVMMVFAVTKFRDGAYVVLILIPVLVGIFWSIHRHYRGLANKLSLDNFIQTPPHTTRHRVILPVSGVHQGTLAALQDARLWSDEVTAIHVVIEPAEAEKIHKKWEIWGEGVRMVMLNTPYRLLLEPLLEYIDDISRQRQTAETMTIVVPEFVSNNRHKHDLAMPVKGEGRATDEKLYHHLPAWDCAVLLRLDSARVVLSRRACHCHTRTTKLHKKRRELWRMRTG